MLIRVPCNCLQVRDRMRATVHPASVTGLPRRAIETKPTAAAMAGRNPGASLIVAQSLRFSARPVCPRNRLSNRPARWSPIALQPAPPGRRRGFSNQ